MKNLSLLKIENYYSKLDAKIRDIITLTDQKERRMSNRNVTEYIKGLVSNAVEEHADGDSVDYDIAMIVQQQAPPIYFVSLTIPSAVLGSYIQGGMVLPEWHQIQQDSMSASVRSALEQLRVQRSQALTKDLSGSEGDNKLLLAK